MRFNYRVLSSSGLFGCQGEIEMLGELFGVSNYLIIYANIMQIRGQGLQDNTYFVLFGNKTQLEREILLLCVC